MSEPTLVVTAEQISERVAQLGREIRNESGTEPILLLCILKGTAVFLADLLRATRPPVSFDFIDVIRDANDTDAADALEIDFLTHFDLRRKRVYLLKDVVSTGVIETYLMNQLRQRQPRELKLVALLDRPDLRTNALTVDYSAFAVKDGTFVGYGLEQEGQYGQLPYLARL